MNEGGGATNDRLLVELLGPAGVGKTTLADSLCGSGDAVMVAPHLKFRDPRNAMLLLRGASPLVPTMLRHPRLARRLTLRHIRMMVQLNCWHRAIERRDIPRSRVILLDHGPLFMLADVREFGSPIVSTSTFLRWWMQALERWLNTLDAVVVLDAPNEVLARRINRRPTAHVVKGVEDAKAFDFLTRYRRAFAGILVGLRAGNGAPELLRVQTSEMSPTEIAVDVGRTLESLR